MIIVRRRERVIVAHAAVGIVSGDGCLLSHCSFILLAGRDPPQYCREKGNWPSSFRDDAMNEGAILRRDTRFGFRKSYGEECTK